jgi:hypothetical protein
MYSKWRGIQITFALAASLALLGCGNTPFTYVRTMNASPGLAGYTVQVGQTGVAASLPYGAEGATPKGQYATVIGAGIYREIGAANNQTVLVYTAPGSTPLATTTASLLKNTDYTIVSLAAAPAIMLEVLTDTDAAPSGGGYGFRFLNASALSGPVDVYITAQGGVPSGTPVIGNAPFQFVNPKHLSEAPGTLEVQITPAGNPGNVLASANFSPGGGNLYTVVFLDPNPGQPPPNAGPTGYGLTIMQDATATTSH